MSIDRLRVFIAGVFVILSFRGRAQETAAADKKLLLKQAIDSKQFVFQAQSARSAKGKTVMLTGGYHFILMGDSLAMDLPYYGKSYTTTTYGVSDLSNRFQSTHFSYTADTTKKGGWQIKIVPVNESKASRIYLSVESNGSCSLSVQSNTRQQISYYGSVEALKD